MTLPDVPPPTDDELSTLFRGLHESDTRPVILSFVSDYAEGYVPRQLSSKYPLLMSELRDERQRDCKALQMQADEDHTDCETVFVDGRHNASRGAMPKRSVFHNDRQVDRQENGQATCDSRSIFRTEGGTHPIARYACVQWWHKRGCIQRHERCLEVIVFVS